MPIAKIPNEQEGAIKKVTDWTMSSIGGLTDWALSTALRATRFLFGTKGMGNEPIGNRAPGTLSKQKTPGTDKRAADRIVELKK